MLPENNTIDYPCSTYFYFADDEEDVNNMEKVMLEYATMDRELNHYIEAFEETINQVNYLFSFSSENIPLVLSFKREKCYI